MENGNGEGEIMSPATQAARPLKQVPHEKKRRLQRSGRVFGPRRMKKQAVRFYT